nr:RecName: Full=Fibrinogen alpha chain; Contains: RecName: Full=Fibrinopeptide A [Antilocapra americana]prf//670960C fibrinopeptide A [Antilocapra americana]
ADGSDPVGGESLPDTGGAR